VALTPEQCEQRTILKILAGSHIHGLNVETSDQDHESIVIEPLSEAIGLGNPWEETERIGHLDSAGKRLPDTKYFSLRKWCRMAVKGNPNFLLPLFAPHSHILKSDARGSQLRDMREAFISKQAIKSHLGYMQGQRNRMLNHNREFGAGGGRGLPRYELIEKYGYDTKFAMHLLRLGTQGVELATTGQITLPMASPVREQLLSVREGKLSLPQVLEWADDLEQRMKTAFDSSSLPDGPNEQLIEEWMQKMYIRSWSAERTLQDRLEDRAVFGVDPRYGIQ